MASFRFNCCTLLRFIPLLIFLLPLTESSQTVGEKIIVGDKDRWRSGVNYTAWAEGRHFHLGDWLAFFWTKGMYDVIEVSAADYEVCNVDNPLWNWSRGNRAAYQLTESRHYYFTCSMGYCKEGMKLNVYAELPLPSSPSESPVSSPPSSPVPKPLPPQSSPPRSPTPKPLPPQSSPPRSPTPKPLPPKSSRSKSNVPKPLPPQISPSRSRVPKPLPPQISPSTSRVPKPHPAQRSSSPSPMPEGIPSHSSPSPAPNTPHSGVGSWVTVDLTRGTLLTALAFVLALV